MESRAKIVLECVSLLSMFMLSLAAVSTPQGSIVKPNYMTKFEICIGFCGLECVLFAEAPPMYAACVAACSAATCIPPTTTSKKVEYGCTHSCVSSMSKVMTSATTKPSSNGLKSYAKGYIDSCYQACSKNNKFSSDDKATANSISPSVEHSGVKKVQN